jgi:hypothetical protein
MSEEKDNSLDILGTKPLAKSIEKTTEKTLEGTGALLSKICLPVAEEFGLFLKDKVKSWRAKNAEKILEKTENKLREQNLYNTKIKSHPLITHKILENSSWAIEDDIQNMWAGLLTSACTIEGKDDSNLTYINILSQMTNSQVKILNYACKNTNTYIYKEKLIQAKSITVELESILELTGYTEIHELDKDLDYMGKLGLISAFSGGLTTYDEDFKDSNKIKANITPSALGIHLYVRSNGYIGDPLKFFNLI